MKENETTASDMAVLLEPMSADIIDEAVQALRTAHYAHYESWGEDPTRLSMTHLYEHVMISLRHHDLAHIIRHCEQVAQRRFTGGFHLVEVQSAFNALEQTLWKRLVDTVPAEQVARNLAVLGTVVGAGKDAVSRTYVQLAAHYHAPAMNVELLADGTV